MSKGFEKMERDHEIYSMVVDGEVTVSTRMSRGSSHREISKDLLSKMSKQLKMSKQQFLEYIECTYTYEDYCKFIKENYI